VCGLRKVIASWATNGIAFVKSSVMKGPGKGSLEERAHAAGIVFERNLLPPLEAGVGVTNLSDFQRLERHLGTVRDKCDLCKDIMTHSDCAANDTLAGEVVGFLEACQRRLPEIIEAGTMGMLCDELLEECIALNDLVGSTVAMYKNRGGDSDGSGGDDNDDDDRDRGGAISHLDGDDGL
jgi:hypothetical protein